MAVPEAANVKAPVQGQVVLVSTDRGQARIMKLEAIALTEAQVLAVLAGTTDLKLTFVTDTANSMKQQWAYLEVVV
jgi:hypothetical protein